MTVRTVVIHVLRVSLPLLVLAACATVPDATSPSTPPGCAHGAFGIEPTDISLAFRASRPGSEALVGAVVGEVIPGSPAEKAGVRAGDLIVRVEEREITNACDAIDALFGGSCAPVSVAVSRNAVNVQLTMIPVEVKPFLSTACKRGTVAACFRLAWMTWSGSGVAKNEARALSLYDDACSDGSAEACAYLGYHMMSQSEPADQVVRVLARACSLGSGAGCAHLGFMYATGTLVQRDDAMSTPIYVRACELGDARGCYNVGIMYRDGRGIPVDTDRAITAYELGCRAGSSTACTDLGWYYQYGESVEQNEARAADLYRRGCEGTHCQPPNRRGCVNMGLTYKDGVGVDKDPQRAAEIFKAACETETDPDDVDPEENRWHACSLLGSMYLIGGELPSDLQLGREFSLRGCEGRDAFGCFNAAVVFAVGMGVDVDMTEAARYYKFACDLDDAEACSALGQLYASGSGVEKDLTRAKQLFEEACAAGFREACGRARNP